MSDQNDLIQHFNEDHMKLNNIESELQKYSLDEQDISNYLQKNHTTDSYSSSNSLDSLPSGTTNTESTRTTTTHTHGTNHTSFNHHEFGIINNKEIPLKDGLIHGHIHNFENFTYIHGHVHTNDPTLGSSSSQGLHTLTAPSNSFMETKKRRRSSHKHSNENLNSQFSDCQHFEFLNCHDKNSVLNIDEDVNNLIQCNEDHEDCVPKIMEICCDGEHEGNDVIPRMPSCTNHEHIGHDGEHGTDHSGFQHDISVKKETKQKERPVSSSISLKQSELNRKAEEQRVAEEHELNCALDDCIDIKCDLDTCDIDELYCRYCEDLDKITNDSPFASNKDQDSPIEQIKEEEEETGQIQSFEGPAITDNSPPVNFKNPLNCVNTETSSSFKKPQEDDQSHTLHHHNFQHSGNHHHHHIQIHDHQPKKFKKSINLNEQLFSSFNKHNNNPKTNNSGNELINFEWNFKNHGGAKCEWENCSTTLENSFQLQNHIVEDHLLSEYSIPPQQQQQLNNLHNFNNITSETDQSISDTESQFNLGPKTSSFECEWKNCDFNGYDLFSLVNHINDSHGFQYDFDINNLIKKNEQQQQKPDEQLPQQLNLPTPSPENSEKGSSSPSIKRQGSAAGAASTTSLEEETTCKWCERDTATGELIQSCNAKFSNAEDLTTHLINHHIGSGKSEYTCLWENCSRNHRNFNQRQKIIRHLHVHTRYKPFVCSICKHSFAVESMLEQHMRTHSGEKPYKCKVCQKNFATSSSLSIHLRTHTGEKPLVCKYPGCGKRFSESSNLTKHIKTHEKLFKCDCCSKSFSKEKQLQSHIARYHSG